MSTLTQIKNAIMRDPQNQSFTERGIEPLFAAPTTARRAPKQNKRAYIGMTKAVIDYVNG